MSGVREEIRGGQSSIRDKYKRYWDRIKRRKNPYELPKYDVRWIMYVGKVAGLPGSPEGIRDATGERILEILQIRNGAAVLIQELWAEKRRDSPPRIDIHKKSLQSDPIVKAENNPFAWAPFSGESDTENSTDNFRVFETIWVPCRNGEDKIQAQTLLDTGTIANAINEVTVKKAGLKVLEYFGNRWITFSGDKFKPLGQVKVDFYFHRRRRARTWTLNFLVVPTEAPFDVLLGRRFIKHAKLFKSNLEALPLGLEQLSKDQKEQVKAETEKRKKENEAIKQKQAEEAKERRKQQKEANSGGNSKL